MPEYKPLRGAPLSERETTVMSLVVSGHTTKQMCAKLDLGRSTLFTYLYRARHKLGAATRIEAAVKFAALKRERGDA